MLGAIKIAIAVPVSVFTPAHADSQNATTHNPYVQPRSTTISKTDDSELETMYL
jgi:hypothetical protein